MKLTQADLFAVEHVEALGFDDARGFAVTGVSTDSRSVKSGDLFVAIRGGKFDGHNFVTTAIEQSAAAVVVDQKWADANKRMMISINVPRLIVRDTVQALGRIANGYRRKFDIPVLAVGGSNGKTTTKEMIRAVLAQKFNVLCTEGNLNNHLGVPQTLFCLDGKHDVAVIEVGTNHRGEIAYLCEILEPTHGLITNVGKEHLEFFGTLDGVAKSEGELFRWLEAHGGTGFINGDDPRIVKQSRKLRKKIVYGLEATRAKVKGAIQKVDEQGCTTVRIKHSGKSFTATLRIPGSHNAGNAVAAAAVGLSLKVPTTRIQSALELFSPSSKRMEVQQLNGITILNDTYNANPDSVIAALATLRSMKAAGKKIAVLADMLELGPKSAEYHKQIGKAVSSSGVAYLLTFGLLSRHTNEAAAVKNKAHYDQKNVLAEYLLEIARSGDVILVKGSRGMKMEEVIAFLQERYHRAA